jgi:hypothetical protein
MHAQAFVFNICCHPDLRNAPELSAFCTSSSPQLHSSEALHQVLGPSPPSLSATIVAKAQVHH